MNLQDELRALNVDWPATPDLTDRVLEQVREPAAPRRRRRWLGGLLAGLLVCATAVSPARSALLEWLGLGSVRIERRAPQAGIPGALALALGQRVSLDRARAAVPFPLQVPQGRTDPSVHLDGGRVHLLYPGPLLVSQERAALGPVIGKAIGPGTTLERLEIDGEPAFWIMGELHEVSYLDASGGFVVDTLRLAGDTLLVERDGLLIRVEGAASKEEAITLVRGMQP